MKNDTIPNKSHNFLSLAIAMALGTAIGILFAPKSGQEMRKDTADKALEIARKFKNTKEEITSKVKNIFGEANDQLERDYIQIKSNILASIDELKDKKDLTKDKFKEISDSYIKQFAREKKLNKDVMENLSNDLNTLWEDLKK